MDSPKLRPYQIEDVNFLSKLQCAACFNEQRTGKTPTALGVVAAKHLQDERVLIITTKSALYPWKEEYERWLNRPCEIVKGTHKKKQEIIETKWTNGLVICLGSFKKTKNLEGFEALIIKQKPKMVILDEAHYIANANTCAAESMYKLQCVPNRLALTGTPIFSKPQDLYGIMHFLFPEYFDSIWKFRNKYLVPKTKCFYNSEGFQTRLDWNNATFSELGKKELVLFLNKVATQRKRKEVMQWLPEKDRQGIRLPMTKEQTKYINQLEDTFEIAGSDVKTIGVMDRLVRMRQIFTDPALIGLKGDSPKTEWIVDFIKDNPDTPVIIFSNFTEYLKRLFITLKKNSIKLAMICGDVSIKKRMLFSKDFQAGKFNVFLIQISSGREALTLDRAEAIIFVDTFPPFGAVEQAEDRFIATTEDKKDKPHVIYYLVMKETYDEQLLRLVFKKKTVAEVINDFKAQFKIKEDGL